MPDLQDAISLFEEGEPRQAADLLEKLAAEMPGYATARVLLARSYEQLNEWEPALRAWREAHQIIPNSPVIRRGLQRAARKAGSRSPIPSPQVTEAPTWGGVPDDEPEAPDAGRDAGSGYTEEPALSAPPEVRPQAQPNAPERPVTSQSKTEPDTEQQAAPISQPTGTESAPQPESAREPDSTRAGESAEELEGAPDNAPGQEAAEPAPGLDAPAASESASEHEIRGSKPGADESSDEAAVEDEYEDLDRLISELESARIVPRPDLESVPPPDLEDDIEDVVSETLARIYASQGQYEEAAHVYELLADQQPEKADEFNDKASDMRSRASEQE